jgi:hypothetical protein
VQSVVLYYERIILNRSTWWVWEEIEQYVKRNIEWVLECFQWNFIQQWNIVFDRWVPPGGQSCNSYYPASHSEWSQMQKMGETHDKQFPFLATVSTDAPSIDHLFYTLNHNFTAYGHSAVELVFRTVIETAMLSGVQSHDYFIAFCLGFCVNISASLRLIYILSK